MRSTHVNQTRRTTSRSSKEVVVKRIGYVMAIVVSVTLVGCGSDGETGPADGGNRSTAPRASTANDATDPLGGTWETHITCRRMVAALEQAGVGEHAPGTVQDEFGLDRRPSQSDPCAGVNGTADHTLRFEGGQFALFAGDELGWEASYELVDDDTFITGAPDMVTFDFRIESGKLFFRVAEPAQQAAETSAPYVATWESAPWEREV
jgi:hypothetical protein